MESIVKKQVQGKGKQKIEIKKIEKRCNLQVAFSKRRNGLFKKAAEFSKRFGVEAAVLVESPGGKLFSFGTPSVENVINRYIRLNNDGGANDMNQIVQELERGEIDNLDLEKLEEIKDALEGLKRNIMARAELKNIN